MAENPNPSSNTPAEPNAASSGAAPAVDPAAAAPKNRTVMFVIVGVIAVVAVLWIYRTLTFSFTHSSTDDAYVTGNTVNVSPLISGTLSQLMVNEGDQVKRGQLIARLDDSQQRAALLQAKAAYAAAQSQLPEAERTVEFQKQSTAAALEKAQAGLLSQKARTAGSGGLVKLVKATTKSQILQAEAQVASARASAAQAKASVADRQAGEQVAVAASEAARRGVGALNAKVLGAQAEVDRTQSDLKRYANLVKQEAVTQQQYDAVASQAANASSNLNSLLQQVAQAEDQVRQAEANVTQARTAVRVAREAAIAAEKQVEVAEAGVELARAGTPQINVNERNFTSANFTEQGSAADVAAAEAGKTQVQIYQQRVLTTRAQVAQAKAALDNAEVQLGYTFIYAPADGQVVRKSANVGASVSTGQTLVTIAQDNAIWVTGNFKETQLGSVRIGQTAEIEADGLPGKKFAAVVASINQATGATTSLLPPDNATGNFTKVVQRIPVRIALLPPKDDEAKADLALLRQGMSVIATIDITDKTPHPDRVPANYNGTAAQPFLPSQKPNSGKSVSPDPAQ